MRYSKWCDDEMGNLPKKEFKREIRRLLLDILVNENYYLETPIIIHKVGLSK